MPKSFLWRLTFLNVGVITLTMLMSGWAIYNTACFLADGIGQLSFLKQQQYNSTLFQYVLIFTFIAVIISSFIHFYFTKRLIRPINELIEATKTLTKGTYPERLNVETNDEVGRLIQHYNKLVEQLQKNDKQRKKLVDDLSHELRTPIANISGYLHALQSGKIEGTPELYTALHEQSLQLADLMEQLGRLNELELITDQTELKKEKVQIKDVIDEAVQMFAWKVEKEGLSIKKNLTEAMVVIDRKAIQQVMNNLIDNAIRYSDGTEPITISSSVKQNKYHISITNKGDPISKEAQEQLFDRFYRIELSRNRKTGGTGLGLAIVKEIIDHHDGSVSVESMNGFNTFTIHLPM